MDAQDPIRRLLESDDPLEPVPNVAFSFGFSLKPATTRAWCTRGYRGVVLAAVRDPLNSGWLTTHGAFKAFLAAISRPDRRLTVSSGLWVRAPSVPATTSAPLPTEVKLEVEAEPKGPGRRVAVGWLPNHTRGRLLGLYQFRTLDRAVVVPIPLGEILPLWRNSNESEKWWRWAGVRNHYLSGFRYESGTLVLHARCFDRPQVRESIGSERITIGRPEALKSTISLLLLMSDLVVGVAGPNLKHEGTASPGQPCPRCGEEGVTDTQKLSCRWSNTHGVFLCCWDDEGALGQTHGRHYLHLARLLQERVITDGGQ